MRPHESMRAPPSPGSPKPEALWGSAVNCCRCKVALLTARKSVFCDTLAGALPNAEIAADWKVHPQARANGGRDARWVKKWHLL